MRFRACIALLLYVSACATSAPSPRESAARDPRLANLQRAATLPWRDGGRCAVQEASEPWPVLAERCYQRCKDDAHNKCADQFPPNRYPGMDVLVGGVSFDALQVGVRVLWEIKTHRFDTYPDFVQGQEIEKEIKQLRKERDAALACGYDFVVGVSTEAHKKALERAEPTLKIVVTGCPR